MTWFLVFFLFFSSQSWAQSSTNQLSLSQGLASPNLTNIVMSSNGFTAANPVAASYQQGYRLSTLIDGSRSSSMGLEAGLGDGQYGLSLGYYSNGCSGCDGYARGALSAIWDPFAIGFTVQEDLYNMGFLLNPHGLHRVGGVVEFTDPDGINNNIFSMGLGYAYVLPSFTFSIDLSKRTVESGSSLTDSQLMVSPSVAVRIDVVSVSLTYDVYLSDNSNSFTDDVWFGVGMDFGKNLNFAIYGAYIDEWTLAGTYFF